MAAVYVISDITVDMGKAGLILPIFLRSRILMFFPYSWVPSFYFSDYIADIVVFSLVYRIELVQYY